MNRRSFLALIASAPIAALAPWPAILQRQPLWAPMEWLTLDEYRERYLRPAIEDSSSVSAFTATGDLDPEVLARFRAHCEPAIRQMVEAIEQSVRIHPKDWHG